MRKEVPMNNADIQERLEMLPALYSTDGMKQREVQIVIYHMFSRWTWYVVEGEKQEDGDWLLFCYCRSGFGDEDDEWGYTTLNQFDEIPYIKAYVPKQTLVIDNNGKLLE